MSEKETRPMPQGRSGARGKARGPKNAKLTIKRLLSYITAICVIAPRRLEKSVLPDESMGVI